MYLSLEQFYQDWKYESEMTLKFFRRLTDESLKLKLNDEVRVLGVLAWHIAYTVHEMPNHSGLNIMMKDQPDYDGETAKEILDSYQVASDSLISELKEKFTDATLSEEVMMYGRPWKKGNMLSILILHQTHHRGQLSILMRQAGLSIPGAYGPSKEEWRAMGMTPLV